MFTHRLAAPMLAVALPFAASIAAAPSVATAAPTSAFSSHIAPSTARLLTAPTPTITGSAVVGSTLTVHPGTWKPSGVKLAYQWLRSGKAISGATHSTYKIAAADKGTQLSVRITGALRGYSTLSRTSKPTVKVTTPAVPSWYSRFPSFTSVTISGVGSKVVAVPKNATAGMVTATFTGSDDFAEFMISALDANRETDDLVLDSFDQTYHGSAPFGEEPFDAAVHYLQVDAEGSWTLTIAPLSSAAEMPASGRGDGVYRYDAGSTGTATFSYTGSDDFAVSQLHNDNGLVWEEPLFFKVGASSGQYTLFKGPSLVVIEAGGNGGWSIKR